MKICAIICEFNPFHNGHKYLLEKAKLLSGCDALLCLMSGNFTQRGEICIADKYTRAKHAVSNGADCVIELPTAFAVAPAEIFAKGAIKLLSAIPDVKLIAFGAENADKTEFLRTAELSLNENDDFKNILSQNLSEGKSYVKSYAEALEKCGGNKEFLSKPNNILGIEYAKAILKEGADIQILPVERIGSGYNDCELKQNFSSASAIRSNLGSPSAAANLPDGVAENLLDYSALNKKFKELTLQSLLWTDTESLNKVFGCNEGLNNALKNNLSTDFDELVGAITTKRYSASRIRRILCANYLHLYTEDCANYLSSPLYLNPLAIRENVSENILKTLSRSEFPLLMRGRDRLKLCKTAEKCLKTDENAHFAYCLTANIKHEPHVKII